MSAERLTLRSAESPGLALRSIRATDLEDLRFWKNANRHAFFTKKELTPEDQARWYAGYRDRREDWMFVVEDGGARSGCLGFRLSEDGSAADVYNVMAAPEARGKGAMKPAMRLLCSFIRKERARRVEAKVVRGNPALKWYEACGYEPAADMREYTLVVLGAAFAPVDYVKEAK